MKNLHKPIAMLVLAVLLALPIMLAPSQAQGATYTLQADNTGYSNRSASGVQLVSWSRVYGKTSYDTMRAITRKGWNTSHCAVITTSEGFADALSASSLAGKLGAPILLVEHNRVPWQTRLELSRMKVKTVYIVGGTRAVNNSVARRLRQFGPKNVYRIWGYTAQDTAVAVSSHLGTKRSKTCFLATPSTFSDALAASPYAARNKAPIFLTGKNGKTISYNTLNAIKRGGYNHVIVVGGSKAVSNGVFNLVKRSTRAKVERVFGSNAYKTAAELARWEMSQGMSPRKLVVARGTRFSDALCAGPWAARNNATLILMSEMHRSDATLFCRDYRVLIGNPPSRLPAYVLGGPAAISDTGYRVLKEATTRNSLPTPPYTHVYSHRGTADPASLEHTFAGYDLVKRQGSRNLEIDVVNSKDGTLYVSHDLSAKRVFGVNRNFADMTDEEIARLRSPNGEPAHTFESVVSRYGSSMTYVVEFKEGLANLNEFKRIVDQHPQSTFVAQCFAPGALEALEATHPDMEKILLVNVGLVLNHSLQMPFVDTIAINQELLSESNSKTIRSAGKRLGVFTPDSDANIIRAIGLEADVIFTNHTARALELERIYRGA